MPWQEASWFSISLNVQSSHVTCGNSSCCISNAFAIILHHGCIAGYSCFPSNDDVTVCCSLVDPIMHAGAAAGQDPAMRIMWPFLTMYCCVCVCVCGLCLCLPVKQKLTKADYCEGTRSIITRSNFQAEWSEITELNFLSFDER